MAQDDRFTVKLIDSRRSYPPETDRQGVSTADLEVVPDVALAALKATPGAEGVLDQVPQISDVAAWLPVAYFRVGHKVGTARYLDLWDVDHFDGFTDMNRSLDEKRAWFSATGHSTWGSPETRTGRVNCYFHAPQDGTYLCTASLQSHPPGATSVVECLIDNSSFGPLPVTGTIHQPHPCNLSPGGHHFRIRQLQGSFFFLSLTVWRV